MTKRPSKKTSKHKVYVKLECNICFEMKLGMKFGCMFCKNFIACEQCLNEWYESCGHKICPHCRREQTKQCCIIL